ncbi:Type II secretion system (T2SS), protein E, N-terminal domain [Granulicella pectinivorans]|uniref:Type II secretion system (T2SS), protein E, N-terminal domain n=1 Tax=Granulicella pectinivorans TaxID=474950 RepID=A0A1I6MNN3_9BACT|nr:hypothetical protein [Granulicella pectinivorans]SFS17305.1 Type II secretion system (T2SS), protein E, N-terminal domain [Granulicella pectinivorans]
MPTLIPGTDQYIPGSGRTIAADPHKRTCANPDCSSAWAKPWKSRRRPIFEGQWGCGSKCLEAIVRASVKREVTDGIGAGFDAPHRHRIPLGLVMLAQGWITHPQLRYALDQQKSRGTGRIGDLLIGECGLPPERITQGLSVQWNCPVMTTEGITPRAAALTLPRVFIEQFGLLPLRIAGSRILYLGFKENLDASAAFALERMSDLKVESGLINDQDYDEARRRLLASDFVPTETIAVRDSEEMTLRMREQLEDRQPIAARLVRVHHFYWFRMWLETGAISTHGTIPGSTEDVHDALFQIGVRA